jgi:pyrroline-5-carboxylate reductase
MTNEVETATAGEANAGAGPTAVLLVGCGRMGSAMARGWAGAHRVLVYDPMAAEHPAGTERIDSLNARDLPDGLVVVLAVKPQVFPSVAPLLSAIAARDPLFLSIMAGTTLAELSEALGGTGRMVRTMPNTPAAIGCGITAAVAGPGLHEGDADVADGLLRATGEVVWLDAEGDLDAVTAVSGSGPAYFFRFTEALAAAGAEAGLAPELAMRLARSTFAGAAALARADSAELAELRRQVTSPGGTTAAGLAQMDADGAIDRLLQAVVDAAAGRSRELSGR